MVALRRPRVRRRARLSFGLSVVVRASFAAILVGWAQADLASVRWWSSPTKPAGLVLTSEQVSVLDRLYESHLPERQRVSAEISDLSVRIEASIRNGSYDEELLRLTERLTRALQMERGLRRQMLERTVSVLTPAQRPKLLTLIASRQVME